MTGSLNLRLVHRKKHATVIEQVVYCGETHIAVRGGNGLINLYNAITGELFQTKVSASSMAWNASRQELATGSRTGALVMWQIGSEGFKEAQSRTSSATGSIDYIAFTNHNVDFVTWNGQDLIQVWETATLRRERTITLPSPPTSLACSPVRAFLLVGFVSKTGYAYRQYDLSTSVVHEVPRGYRGTAFAWNRTGTVFAMAEKCSKHCRILIVKGETRRTVARFQAHIGTITCLAWACRDKVLLSTGRDGFIRLWGVIPKTDCLSYVHAHPKGCNMFALSPAGTHVVSGSFDKLVKVWEIKQMREVQTQIEWGEEWAAVELQRQIRGCLARTRLRRRFRLLAL